MSNTKIDPSSLKVGSQLFVATSSPGRTSQVDVVKSIGRKYLTMGSGLRFDLVTLAPVSENGYAHRSSLWPDAQTYEDHSRKQRMWEHLRARTSARFAPPAGFSAHAVKVISHAMTNPALAELLSSLMMGLEIPNE